MSISTEIQRLQGAKADIKSAIEAKGVTVSSSLKLDGYASKIAEIPTGGGTEAPENDVNFYDYDGFRVASFTIAEAKALTQAEYDAILPPAHDGLTFEEWNWTLADIQGYNRQYIDIGANYVTTDGKTHIKIDVPFNDYPFTIRIGFITSGYNVVVDWGDGTDDTYTTHSTPVHNYDVGVYDIAIYLQEVTDDVVFYVNNMQNNNTIATTSRTIKEVNQGKNCYIGFNAIQSIVSMCSNYGNSSYYGTFNASVIPCVTLPKNSSTTQINSFYQFRGKICLPKQMGEISATRLFSGIADSRFVIPEYTTVSTVQSFIGCTWLKVISFPLSYQMASGNNVFQNCGNLRTIEIVNGWIPNLDMTLSMHNYLSADDMVAFFQKLGTTTTARTLTFGSVNLGRLTEAQKQIATDKGYTLA